jgi:hypothetical protein
LRITECEFPVVIFIHIFLENFEVVVGVDGSVEENGAIYVGTSQGTQLPTFCECKGTPHEGDEYLKESTFAYFVS